MNSADLPPGSVVRPSPFTGFIRYALAPDGTVYAWRTGGKEDFQKVEEEVATIIRRNVFAKRDEAPIHLPGYVVKKGIGADSAFWWALDPWSGKLRAFGTDGQELPVAEGYADRIRRTVFGLARTRRGPRRR